MYTGILFSLLFCGFIHNIICPPHNILNVNNQMTGRGEMSTAGYHGYLGVGKGNAYSPSKTVLISSILKFARLKIPHKPSQNLIMSYVCLILINLSSDVEVNPGPHTSSGSRGTHIEIKCQNCNIGYSLDSEHFPSHVRTSSFVWTCNKPNCKSSNFVQNFNIDPNQNQNISQNRFSPLHRGNSHSISINKPIKSKSASKPVETNKSPKTHLSILNLNCQSLIRKKDQFHAIIKTYNPDIVVGTESWLTSQHLNSEYFPDILGYKTFRKDRVTDTQGGGIFILVKSCLNAVEVPELKTNCEILWFKINQISCKPIFVSAYYKPHENDTISADQFYQSVKAACKLSKGLIWIAGDFNYPKFDWDIEHNPVIRETCTHKPLYTNFIDLLQKFHLTQMVTEPNRKLNTLDYFITSNPTLVYKIETLAGIADHSMVFCTALCKPEI